MIAQTTWSAEHASLLLLIIFGLVVITIIGVVWAIVRERHLVDLSSEQTQSVRDMERTFVGVTETLRSLGHQVERSDELSEARRQEFIRLIVDVERRLTDTMRDWMARIHQSPAHGTSVNIHGPSSGTQIGDGNRQL